MPFKLCLDVTVLSVLASLLAAMKILRIREVAAVRFCNIEKRRIVQL